MSKHYGDDPRDWARPVPQHNDGERVRAPEPTICKKHGSVTPPDIPCPHCRADALAEANKRLRGFAGWLVAMDEPDSSQRRTVTLTQIIEEARKALSTPEKGKG